MNDLKAPFPWFGGKRRVAPQVWAAFGDVDHYVEPFAGSLAVLLARPDDHTGRTETVNDADGFVANFWRALAADPAQVAFHADWPVNETDLFARHMWLVNDGLSLLDRLHADPEWYDPKIAGWWVWGISSWIGHGWCAGTGPWAVSDGKPQTRTHRPDATRGVKRSRPHLGNTGQGINAARGVNRNRPHLKGYQGINAVRGDMAGYLWELSDRLRRVRVCCGDWSRVTTRGALTVGNTVGVFLDPPYLGDVRTADLYAVDDHTIAHDVRQWCLDNGDNPRYRIVLAGYTDEHDHLTPPTWRRHQWSASNSYQTAASAVRPGGNVDNRHKECLWMSPHCLDDGGQLDLFGAAS